jgi:hypothetical protein
VSVQRPATVRHYWERADSFRRAAELLYEYDPAAYAPAVGLLSVHGCIALADALLVAAEGQRPRGEDHAQAARQLRGWCSAKQIPENGVKHLDWLLSHKTRFSYDERSVDAEDLKMAKVKMEQFFKWAVEGFPDVPQVEETGDA